MRKGSWNWDVEQLLERYEAELNDAGYDASIRRLRSNDQAIGVEIPGHIVFVGNSNSKEIKARNLRLFQQWAHNNDLESSVIFYNPASTSIKRNGYTIPTSEQMFQRVHETHKYPRSNAMSLYNASERRNIYSFTEREQQAPQFHQLPRTAKGRSYVNQFAYNIQSEKLETAIMQTVLRDYSHLYGSQKWEFAQRNHGTEYVGRFLSTKRVPVSITDIVQRNHHNQVISGIKPSDLYNNIMDNTTYVDGRTRSDGCYEVTRVTTKGDSVTRDRLLFDSEREFRDETE